MSTILDYIDDTTEKVVEIIVEQYQKDLNELNYLPSENRDGVGVTLREIISRICDCSIIRYDDSFCVVSQVSQEVTLSVVEDTAYRGNIGFINQTKVIQIINFIIQLSKEGYIVLTEFGKSKAYPTYKGVSENDTGLFYLPIRNQEVNSFLELAYFSHVCPTATLEKFKKRRYTTVEYQRYLWTQICSWAAIFVAIVIGLLQFCKK